MQRNEKEKTRSGDEDRRMNPGKQQNFRNPRTNRRSGAKSMNKRRGTAQRRAERLQKHTGENLPESTGNRKKRKKRGTFDVISAVVLIAAVCVFVFSLYQLVIQLVPYHTGGQEYDDIRDLAITADESGDGFSVDFDELLGINPDTVAWIRFDEPSVINYPVVKSADNNEYLTKTFAENDNKLGAIFMDMRNSSDFSDKNTIIYGHHLNVSAEMFSRLHLYEDEEFCQEHPNFYIYTPDGSVRTYTVFSAGVVNAAADNYDIAYASDEEFGQYIELCRESSNYQVDVEVNAQSQIVSLSTCTGNQRDERFLLQGVLTAVD